MRKTRKSLKVLLAIYLSSCQTIPRQEVTQCVVETEQELCLCRTYLFSPEFIGPITKPESYPYYTCNKMVGFPALDYVIVQDYWEEVRRQLSKEAKKNE